MKVKAPLAIQLRIAATDADIAELGKHCELFFGRDKRLARIDIPTSESDRQSFLPRLQTALGEVRSDESLSNSQIDVAFDVHDGEYALTFRIPDDLVRFAGELGIPFDVSLYPTAD